MKVDGEYLVCASHILDETPGALPTTGQQPTADSSVCNTQAPVFANSQSRSNRMCPLIVSHFKLCLQDRPSRMCRHSDAAPADKRTTLTIQTPRLHWSQLEWRRRRCVDRPTLHVPKRQ
jgi:hypothetical protein